MSRPTTRVLAVLELLQSHGHLGGGELARRLEVDRRTIRRYIAQLEEMGIPIVADYGPEGGYALVAGFKLPPLMFTSDEAVALALGLLAAKSLGLTDAAPAVAGAQAKLERVMPAALKEQVRKLDAAVALELTEPIAAGDPAVLVALSGAARDGHRVFLRYRDLHGRDTDRELDPYGLAFRRGRWYLVGHCHLRGGLRSFRLDRVREARPLAARFQKPAGFDVLEHLAQSAATIPREFPVELLLRTDLATARRLLYPSAGLLEWVEGGVLLRGHTDNLAFFARELARLPVAFEIRQPAALRDALAVHARALLGGLELQLAGLAAG